MKNMTIEQVDQIVSCIIQLTVQTSDSKTGGGLK